MPSSVVASMKYDAGSHKLRIVFVSGDVYDYKNVPQKVFDEMQAAASKGTFLNQTIKKRYKFEKVE